MFFTLSSFHFVLYYFFVKKMFLHSSNSIEIFTPFALLDSLLFFKKIEYIFYFNPSNLLIEMPLYSSFILPITFLWVGSKIFDWYSLRSNKFFINIFWFDFVIETICVSKQPFSINSFLDKVAVKSIHQPFT